MYKPTPRTMLYEEIINQIIELIKTGQWTPGEKIPTEIELSQHFQVSRNSMREALKVLEHLKIIASKAGSGTFLLEDSILSIGALELASTLRQSNSLEQLMETRLIIEPELAHRAALNATNKELTKLEESLDKSFHAVEQNTYLTTVGFSFHMEIAKISKNELLYKFLESITLELLTQRKILRQKHLSEQDLLNEIKEHRKIFQYIKERNPEQARQEMYHHIKNAEILLRNKR